MHNPFTLSPEEHQLMRGILGELSDLGVKEFLEGKEDWQCPHCPMREVPGFSTRLHTEDCLVVRARTLRDNLIGNPHTPWSIEWFEKPTK